MTEKELKSMYDKMSLSEERLSELEKRLDDCFDHAPERFQDADGDELLHFDAEYKPSPRRRSPLKIALTSAAAVVVVAGGITAAFKTGLIPTGMTVPESSSADDSEVTATAETAEITNPDPVVKHGITSADLPEYSSKGILDSDLIQLDSETFDETAANDIQSLSLLKSVLIAEMTVTDCDYEWDSGDTVYTVTVDKAYYVQMGINPEGTSIKLLMPGGINYQYEGCPLYTKGDRIFAALRSGERFYEVSAAQTIADIITINGMEYAAAHSKELPETENLAGEDVLTYDRTVTRNPAKYYGIYSLNEFVQYYLDIAVNSERPEYTPEGSFNTADLTFSTDSEALANILEPNFFGRWQSNGRFVYEVGVSNVYDEIYMQYKPGWNDVFKTLNDIDCGGFAEDENAYYMLDNNDGGMVWSIMKDNPETLYRYEGLTVHDRADYADSFQRSMNFSGNAEVNVPGDITTLGLLKVLSGYDEVLTEAVKRGLTGLAEYDSVTWHNTDLKRSEFKFLNIPDEKTWLLKKTDSEFSIVVRKYALCEAGKNFEGPFEEWRGLPVGTVYNGKICRYFRMDYSKNADGKWECSDFGPISGNPSDMDNFFSPLTDTYMYRSQMMNSRAHPDKEVTVDYYAVENNGQTDIYAMRKIKDIFDGVDEYDIYYRDPRTDEYTLLAYGQALALVVEDTGSVLIGGISDGYADVTRYKGGCEEESTSVGQALEGRIELIPHGDFIVAGFDDNSGGRYAVLESSRLLIYGSYERDLLKITDDSLEVLNEYDNKYTKIELTDELQIQALEKKALWLWCNFEIDAPAGTGYYMTLTSDGHGGKVIADPELRTYDGIVKLFSEVYTDEAVADAMSLVIGHSVLDVDGRTFTTEGSRGSNISVWSVGFTIPEETKTDASAVLDFTITYVDPDTSEILDKQDHYTINAVKTENGWRLDRFYYPY